MALVGMQVPPSDEAAFAEAQSTLRDEFQFDELSGDARDVFDMFIS